MSEGPLAGDLAARVAFLEVELAREREERKYEALLAERERDDSASMLHEIVENLGAVFFLRDFDTNKMLYVNQAYETVWGRDVERALANPSDFVDAIVPEDRDRIAKALSASGTREKWFDEEYRIRRPDGEMRWIHARAFPVLDSRGRAYRVAGFAADISAQREAEVAQIHAEKLLREVVDGIREVFFVCEVGTGRVLYLNRAFEEVWGLSLAEMNEHPERFFESVLPEDRERVEREIAEHLRTGPSFEHEYRIRDTGGRTRWMRVRGFPVPDLRGQVTRFAGIGEDFSLRKADEERREALREDLEVLVAQKTLALKESLRLFEAMASQSPTGIYRTDLSGHHTFVNSRYCEIAGLLPEEALGTGWVTAIRPEEREEALAAWRAAVSEFQTPLSREVRFVGKNGEARIAIAHAQLELDTSGRPIGYIGSLVDVTDLRRLEDLLLRTEYLAKVGSWEWDLSSGRVRWSPEMFRLHAVEAKPEGKPDLTHVVQRISPEDFLLARGSLEKALKTGSLEPVHYTVKSQDGGVRHLVGEGEVEFGPDGAPAKLRGFVQDLTERELAKQALERSLAEKSVLLKEIHHRVKNSLQIVASLLYLQGRRSKDEATRLMIGESRDRLISMALIHEMLYQADDLSRIDFGSYLRKLVDRIFATYGGGGFTVRTEVFSNAEPIEIGVAIPCGLIVNELATNAFKYAFREDGGCLRTVFTQEGRQFRLEVADDGAGLAPQIDLNLADTFGFTIVRTLTTQLNGELSVDRSSGGTRISISFCRGGPPE